MVRFYRNLNIFAEIQWLWQSFLVRIWNNENALKPKPFQSVFSIPSLFFFFFPVDFVFALVCDGRFVYTYTWLCLRLLADGFTGSCASMEQRMDAVQVSRMYLYLCVFYGPYYFLFQSENSRFTRFLLEESYQNFNSNDVMRRKSGARVIFTQDNVSVWQQLNYNNFWFFVCLFLMWIFCYSFFDECLFACAAPSASFMLRNTAAIFTKNTVSLPSSTYLTLDTQRICFHF